MTAGLFKLLAPILLATLMPISALAANKPARSDDWSVILKQDRVEELFEDIVGADGKPIPILSQLSDMQARGLMRGATSHQPWSDSYWPLFKGGIAARYAIEDFDTNSQDWREFQKLSQRKVDTNVFSPSEKYEFALGLERNPITNSMWSLVQTYQKKYGEVESWIGICNGWAYASDRLPRPRHPVEVKVRGRSGDLTSVTFYPSDIKALGSFLWSKRELPFLFVGRRCNDKNPATTPEGRVSPSNPDCLDSNPATWHKAVVNQVGLRQKSFVFDARYDYEIWNFPVRSYRYTYFNPETGRAANSLEQAQSPVGFSGDKFAGYRSAGSATVVGIVMDVTYIDEIDPPTHARADSEAKDKVSSVRYLYDLEIDKKGHVIGGEWYQTQHPDFIWTISSQIKPTSRGDALMTETWSGQEAVPKSWMAAANEASTAGELLPAFVEALFSLSQ